MSLTWKNAKVIAIPKTNQDLQTTTSYRDISLTSSLCKTIEIIVNIRLRHYIEKYDLIDNYQTGFTQNKCTLDSLGVV